MGPMFQSVLDGKYILVTAGLGLSPNRGQQSFTLETSLYINRWPGSPSASPGSEMPSTHVCIPPSLL